MRNILSILIVLFMNASNIFPQVKIIFDTDFEGDADDLGALAMLHNLMDRGECELIGIMCWSTAQYTVPGIDAVNFGPIDYAIYYCHIVFSPC